LQAGAFATLLLAGALLLAGRELLGGDAPILGRWGTVFVLVPVSYVPALVVWHRWAIRRFGRRPATLRLLAEVAFAAELIGCVLYLRLA
jgi:hypothetical protein